MATPPSSQNSTSKFFNTRIEVDTNIKGKEKATNVEEEEKEGAIEKVSAKRKLMEASWREGSPDVESRRRQRPNFSDLLRHLLEVANGGNNARNGDNSPDQASTLNEDVNTKTNSTPATVLGESESEAETDHQQANPTHLTHEQHGFNAPLFTANDDAIDKLHTANEEASRYEFQDLTDSLPLDHLPTNNFGIIGDRRHLAHTNAQVPCNNLYPASPHHQPDFDVDSSQNRTEQQQPQYYTEHSEAGPSSLQNRRAVNMSKIPISGAHDNSPRRWAYMTPRAYPTVQAPTNEQLGGPSASTTPTLGPPPGFPAPPPGFPRTSTPLPAPTPRSPTLPAFLQQRVGQSILREDTPRTRPYVHGAWPNPEDIQRGFPANPLTWEELVAIRRMEDQLRASGALRALDNTGVNGESSRGNGALRAPTNIRANGEGGTGVRGLAAFGHQHTQSSDDASHIRDSGERNFRDTYWEHTLHPSPQAWAYNTRFNRTRAQHVCHCYLCQRMGRWFADPTPPSVEAAPAVEESLNVERLVHNLVD